MAAAGYRAFSKSRYMPFQSILVIVGGFEKALHRTEGVLTIFFIIRIYIGV
jgi:hypothetical protein